MTIPWAKEDVWSQATLSITRTIAAVSAESSVGMEVEAMYTLAQDIVDGYTELETLLERVCFTTCTTCNDVCCIRATVWYDVKDLLVMYLNTGALPGSQIYRRSDNSCCNLTPTGCRLPRSERPFICTWYICPEQNRVLRQSVGGNDEPDIFHIIDEIKKARKDLEQIFVKISNGH